MGLHPGLDARRRAQGLEFVFQRRAQRVLAFEADHRLAGQVLQGNVLLLRLQPAVGREQLQLALGQWLAMNVGVFGVVQAQAQIAFAQQQAADDVAGRLR